jgi:DNA-binding PadR family transcriptional regulator
MSTGHALLGLLESGPKHGYELKRAYDGRFGQDRPLAYGQVYATLSRLLKAGLIEVGAVESGDGPDRKTYAITEAGIADLATWLGTPEKPDSYLHSTLFTKIVIALLTGRGAADLVDAQRAAHLAVMRTLTKRKSEGELTDVLICDHALFHLEADLRWLELAAARLDQLAGSVTA